MPDFRLQRLGSPLELSFGGARSFSLTSLNGSTIKAAWSFPWLGPAPSSPLTHLGFRYGVRVGTPPTYKISLQGPNASGEPNGTLKGGGNPTFLPPADTTWDGLFKWISLGASTYTPARGEQLMILVEYSSGTVSSVHYSSFTTYLSGAGRSGYPCSMTYNGTTWTKQTGGPPVFGVKNGSQTWGFPLQAASATAINATTQHALAFKLDAVTLGQRIAGVRLVGQLTGLSAKSVKAVLYEGTTAVGHDFTIDGDHAGGVGSGDMGYTIAFDEATLALLKTQTQYYLAFEPQEADTNFAVNVLEYAAAQDAGVYPGGAQFQFASRASGGATAWTLDSTKRSVAELIVEEVEGPQVFVVQRRRLI